MPRFVEKMQVLLVGFVICLGAAAAFSLPARSSSRSKIIMSAKDMVGSVSPTGYFDPLQLSEGRSQAELKKYREAELKHGRICMVAAIGILVGESFNPFFDGLITGPAIYQFQQADDLLSYFWVLVLFTIGLVEGQNILSGWETPAGASIAQLKEDYVNGDLGFDPMGLKPTSAAAFDRLRTKELQNGRLAMIGVAGMVAQELVNGKGILENIFG